MRLARALVFLAAVVVPTSARAASYIVHVGGMCSQYFTDPNAKGGGGRVANVAGYSAASTATRTAATPSPARCRSTAPTIGTSST